MTKSKQPFLTEEKQTVYTRVSTSPQIGYELLQLGSEEVTYAYTSAIIDIRELGSWQLHGKNYTRIDFYFMNSNRV